MSVELRHLAALSAICQEGTFSGAADLLGYRLAAISRQISYLERHVGTRLVNRTRGIARVSMTAAGLLLVEHTTAVMARLREPRPTSTPSRAPATFQPRA
jgi:DNA-binding transcriptional LysR family regulator